MTLQEHISLREHSTFYIGGSARYFVLAESNQDIIEAVEFAKANNIAVAVIGAGCNLIIRDDIELDGLIIKIATKNIQVRNTKITADAGVSFSALTAESHKHGLIGLEWFPAVPSSVGGGVRGNAGAFGGEAKDMLESVTILRNGLVQTIPKEEVEFRYRYSSFKHPENTDIILAATFQLKKGDVSEARRQVRDFIQKKQLNQPVGVACSGCIFQNYDQGVIEDKNLIKQFPELLDFNKKGIIPSGYLIEKTGLKGKKIGGAEVSMKHANYIINPEKQATFQDVQDLIQLIKSEVHKTFCIWIQEEAVYLENFLLQR